ncbi:hypothetical protein [Candidatus Sulfurimonas baltica]|uniref:Uncharacterized protein n=1 Tax=Candidatus Sulfurimonas baltica TaxID=2740404 RepID=A0A7S7LV77_9BACT|nr:hypothetical protein [Candidatus Sulfurimonas baltica]QOY51364.1 hypothetical protein HUE88_09555 [Candidatus Sulfurimonas baltica]
MRAVTNIDNITLQITCDDKEEQREKLEGLIAFVEERDFLKVIRPQYAKKERDIKIRNKRNTIAKIGTGVYCAGKDMNGKKIVKHYIAIKFAGLSKYIKRLDSLSNNLLFSIAAYMNSHESIEYTLTAIDICIDLECRFEHMAVICTKHVSRSQYYELTEKQTYITTNNIERMSKAKLKRAALRSYFYYKTRKDKLDYPLSRYELKLNSKFLKTHGVKMDAIENALNRYHVMYFKDLAVKKTTIEEYTRSELDRQKKIDTLKLEDYRVYADINYIEHFLNVLFNLDEALLTVDRYDI